VKAKSASWPRPTEMFGGATSGFAALAALNHNQDGLVDADVPMDRNNDGVSVVARSRRNRLFEQRGVAPHRAVGEPHLVGAGQRA
jgi:hypothetical protein